MRQESSAPGSFVVNRLLVSSWGKAEMDRIVDSNWYAKLGDKKEVERDAYGTILELQEMFKFQDMDSSEEMNEFLDTIRDFVDCSGNCII